MAVASPMATESRSSSSSRRSLKRCRSFGHLAKGLGVVGAAAGCCTLLVATTQSTSGEQTEDVGCIPTFASEASGTLS